MENTEELILLIAIAVIIPYTFFIFIKSILDSQEQRLLSTKSAGATAKKSRSNRPSKAQENKVYLYRGAAYNPNLTTVEPLAQAPNDEKIVIKYRGGITEISPETSIVPAKQNESDPPRLKYRGCWINEEK